MFVSPSQENMEWLYGVLGLQTTKKRRRMTNTVSPDEFVDKNHNSRSSAKATRPNPHGSNLSPPSAVPLYPQQHRFSLGQSTQLHQYGKGAKKGANVLLFTEGDDDERRRGGEHLQILQQQRAIQSVPLLAAVREGDFAKVTQLVANETFVLLQERGMYGETAMHVCLLYSSPAHFKILRYLIQVGGRAIINTYSTHPLFYGETPLHVAVVRGKSELVKVLVDAGADISARATGTFFKPSGPCYYGEMPLSFAAATGEVEVIHHLCQSGAPMFARDRYGNTAAHIAAVHNQPLAYLALKEEEIRNNYIRRLDLSLHPQTFRRLASGVMTATTPLSPQVEGSLQNANQSRIAPAPARDGTGAASGPSPSASLSLNGASNNRQGDHRAKLKKKGTNRRNGAPDILEEEHFRYKYLHTFQNYWRETPIVTAVRTADAESVVAMLRAERYILWEYDDATCGSAYPIRVLQDCLEAAVDLKRRDILSHPLVCQLMNEKWNAQGGVETLFLCSLISYMVYLVLLSTAVSQSLFQPSNSQDQSEFVALLYWPTSGRVVLWICCVMSFLKLVSLSFSVKNVYSHPPRPSAYHNDSPFSLLYSPWSPLIVFLFIWKILCVFTFLPTYFALRTTSLRRKRRRESVTSGQNFQKGKKSGQKPQAKGFSIHSLAQGSVTKNKPPAWLSRWRHPSFFSTLWFCHWLSLLVSLILIHTSPTDTIGQTSRESYDTACTITISISLLSGWLYLFQYARVLPFTNKMLSVLSQLLQQDVFPFSYLMVLLTLTFSPCLLWLSSATAVSEERKDPDLAFRSFIGHMQVFRDMILIFMRAETMSMTSLSSSLSTTTSNQTTTEGLGESIFLVSSTQKVIFICFLALCQLFTLALVLSTLSSILRVIQNGGQQSENGQTQVPLEWAKRIIETERRYRKNFLPTRKFSPSIIPCSVSTISGLVRSTRDGYLPSQLRQQAEEDFERALLPSSSSEIEDDLEEEQDDTFEGPTTNQIRMEDTKSKAQTFSPHSSIAEEEPESGRSEKDNINNVRNGSKVASSPSLGGPPVRPDGRSLFSTITPPQSHNSASSLDMVSQPIEAWFVTEKRIPFGSWLTLEQVQEEERKERERRSIYAQGMRSLGRESHKGKEKAFSKLSASQFGVGNGRGSRKSHSQLYSKRHIYSGPGARKQTKRSKLLSKIDKRVLDLKEVAPSTITEKSSVTDQTQQQGAMGSPSQHLQSESQDSNKITSDSQASIGQNSTQLRPVLEPVQKSPSPRLLVRTPVVSDTVLIGKTPKFEPDSREHAMAFSTDQDVSVGGNNRSPKQTDIGLATSVVDDFRDFSLLERTPDPAPNTTTPMTVDPSQDAETSEKRAGEAHESQPTSTISSASPTSPEGSLKKKKSLPKMKGKKKKGKGAHKKKKDEGSEGELDHRDHTIDTEHGEDSPVGESPGAVKQDEGIENDEAVA